MFVAGNPPLLWQLVGEREELQLLQQTLPSEHPAQTQEWEEAGAGLGRLPCSLKPHFCVCVCVCAGAAAGGQGMGELEPLGCECG